MANGNHEPQTSVWMGEASCLGGSALLSNPKDLSSSSHGEESPNEHHPASPASVKGKGAAGDDVSLGLMARVLLLLFMALLSIATWIAACDSHLIDRESKHPSFSRFAD